jgi:DNA modification methylase
MTPTRKILLGDCRETLKQIPDGTVQCCVTSPPYFGLRSYGDSASEIGREKTPEEFIETMVGVFREVKRVLREDGTLWVNIGDSYAASRSYQVTDNKNPKVGAHNNNGRVKPPLGLKEKDLIGIPWTLAFALRADGWYLRSDIIWHKPNPMPESVTDRPTKSHEYIFLLTKSRDYFYDAEAILEPCSESTHARLSQNVQAQIGSERANGGAKTNGNMKAVARKSWKGSNFDNKRDLERHPNVGKNRVKDNMSMDSALAIMPEKRNKRSVWTVPTFSFSDAHFATYPPDLIKPCILAGSKVGDTVLDPFSGSGTTGQVAGELGRNFIGCELYEKFLPMIERRTSQPGLMLA